MPLTNTWFLLTTVDTPIAICRFNSEVDYNNLIYCKTHLLGCDIFCYVVPWPKLITCTIKTCLRQLFNPFVGINSWHAERYTSYNIIAVFNIHLLWFIAGTSSSSSYLLSDFCQGYIFFYLPAIHLGAYILLLLCLASKRTGMVCSYYRSLLRYVLSTAGPGLLFTICCIISH